MGGGPERPPRWREAEQMETKEQEEYLHGIIDMGSNGIRFSVSSLAPPMSRILPTVISYRVDISLYSAQYSSSTGAKIPIPNSIIRQVIAAFLRFKIICSDLSVPDENIRIIATEATRTAINSVQFREEIKDATGLKVEMLEKEEEGWVGALGVASGFSDVSGLVMDLGGGSAQITWMTSRGGHVDVSPVGSRSFPYGAAALTEKLKDLRRGKGEKDGEKAVDDLREEMKSNFRTAYQELRVPEDMAKKARVEGGFPLYLSGGGFRGWGYILLYLSQVKGRHYPISLINGFSVNKEQFEDTEAMKEAAKTAHTIFRVSDRRRDQVPAVAFLVNALATSLPHGIKNAHFAQGGVREGILYRTLDPSVRKQDPLEVATQQFARQSAGDVSKLFMASIPQPGARRMPESISEHVIHGFANVLYVHASMSKETASTAALYSTSTGIMSATHGVSHFHRALMALMLERRYEGELPPRETDFKLSLQEILTDEECWWAQYIGAVGLLLSKAYPAGVIDPETPRVKISSEWASWVGEEKENEGLRLIFEIKKIKNDPMMLKESLEDHVGDIQKVGKKKHWIGAKDGWGMAIDTVIREVDGW